MSMDLFEDALFMSIPVLNLITGESGWKGISAHIDTTLLEELGPKEQAESAIYQSHQRRCVLQYVVSQPFNKEGKKLGV